MFGLSKTGSAGFAAAFVFAALGIYLVRGLAGVQLNPWVDTFFASGSANFRTKTSWHFQKVLTQCQE
ncbi:MAG: hypothetical protein Ct9H300mP28_18940 [Pseudomonadota bacterium]|nr:MAG: hypothetical protein Ct9H300mP28_18940 [Pseudomonadota bacterium]